MDKFISELKLKYRALLDWIKKQKISFIFYLIGVMFIIFSVGYKPLVYVSAACFIVGFLIDSIKFLNLIESTKWYKYLILAFSIIVYFTYPYAEALANQTVYELVGEDISSFGNTIVFLKGLFFIPALIVSSASIIGLLFGVITLASSTIPIFDILGLVKYKKTMVHIFFYLTALTVTFFTLVNINYESLLGEDFIAKKLIKYSYYPNKTCVNIENNRFINFIDSDTVSVASINQYSKSDSNITFETHKCVRKIAK